MTQHCVPNVGLATGTGPISLGEASSLLKELADFPLRGEKVKAAIERAAKLVRINFGSRLDRLTYWRAFDIWYEKAKCFRDYEGEAIIAAVRHKREQDAANELSDLRGRIELLESRLRSGDADFHGPTISALRNIVRARG